MEKSVILISLFFFGMALNSFSQDNSREVIYEEGDTAFTMKQYVFCLYTSGTERSQSSEEAAELQN